MPKRYVVLLILVCHKHWPKIIQVIFERCVHCINAQTRPIREAKPSVSSSFSLTVILHIHKTITMHPGKEECAFEVWDIRYLCCSIHVLYCTLSLTYLYGVQYEMGDTLNPELLCLCSVYGMWLKADTRFQEYLGSSNGQECLTNTDFLPVVSYIYNVSGGIFLTVVYLFFILCNSLAVNDIGMDDMPV